MSEAKFTKGEWVASVNDGAIKRAVIYLDGGGFDISMCPECVANAHLIAAAPEMYEMLQALLDAEGIIKQPCNRKAVKALLAKARGEK